MDLLAQCAERFELMFRRVLVGEIAIIDFHSYVTVGPPLLPGEISKKLHN